MEKFRNKYRIPSARLKNWDYGWNGSYFITICTANRRHFFGEIRNGEMHLNDSGMMAEKLWVVIPDLFPFALLGESIIMPNHIHGILMIDKDICSDVIPHVSESKLQFITDVDVMNHVSDCAEQDSESDINRDTINRVPTGGITGNHNPMFYDNISRIIRWYKGRTSFELHRTNPGFNWQSRFYDHIIRDDVSYQKISEYIRNNPRNWKDDEFHYNL